MSGTKKPSKEGGRKPVDDASKLDRLRELVAILEGSSTLTSLDYEDADIVVRLSREAALPTPMMAHVSSERTSSSPSAGSVLEIVTSPFIGTFHRYRASDEGPLTEVGAVVEPNQILGVIEAMATLNEVRADVSGQVVAIVPEHGQAVHFGDPLFKIAVRT